MGFQGITLREERKGREEKRKEWRKENKKRIEGKETKEYR